MHNRSHSKANLSSLANSQEQTAGFQQVAPKEGHKSTKVNQKLDPQGLSNSHVLPKKVRKLPAAMQEKCENMQRAYLDKHLIRQPSPRSR